MISCAILVQKIALENNISNETNLIIDVRQVKNNIFVFDIFLFRICM